jgi:hypothetical protein
MFHSLYKLLPDIEVDRKILGLRFNPIILMPWFMVLSIAVGILLTLFRKLSSFTNKAFLSTVRMRPERSPAVVRLVLQAEIYEPSKIWFLYNWHSQEKIRRLTSRASAIDGTASPAITRHLYYDSEGVITSVQ